MTTTIAAVAGVEEKESGLASGLINTSQQIGGALGLAVLSSIATSHTAGVLADGSGLKDALTEGFQVAFLGGAAIAALGFVLTLVLIQQQRQPRPRRTRQRRRRRGRGGITDRFSRI